MSTPKIPGYSLPDESESLANLWQPPEGNYPKELWPEPCLQEIEPDPIGWLTIIEYYFDDEKHGGKAAILIDESGATSALSVEPWIGRDLGRSGVWTGPRSSRLFDDGLSSEDQGVRVEFLGQVREQHGLRNPVVEISYPFPWYWDAIECEDGWYYLNRAGRDQPLIRTEVHKDCWKVQVRALELRRFLADAERVLLVQIEHVAKLQSAPFGGIDDEFESAWASFTWDCIYGKLSGDRQSCSRLLGQYMVEGSMTACLPSWERDKSTLQYPEFQYGVKSSSGEPLTHTCDPDQLGTYFDKDPALTHYLTPVYFTPDVLTRYLDDPGRYRVDSGNLTCLDIWSVSISTNTAGLIEVYLGDIGRDIPADEWPHWKTHNVPPEGQMAEDRFRRDFLAQFASPEDPSRDLKSLKLTVNARAKEVLGIPIWRDLNEPDKTDFDRLHAPASPSPERFTATVLTLTKALAESIDGKALARYLELDESKSSSLILLENLVRKLGGNKDIVEPLKALQNLRSKGGIAHLSSRQREAALSRVGIQDMNPNEAYRVIVDKLLKMLKELEELLGHSD